MHRLGGVGIAAFERHEQSQRSFEQLSHVISQSQVEHLHIQLTQFRAALAHFAKTHRESIKKDPTFRHAFQKMCLSIGVDPLAGPRKGGWWAELLGLADWQSELGVQIIDICVSTRDRNGGIIELQELVRMITRLRGINGETISEEDIIRSIKTLEPLGAGYQVVDVGGKRMIRSVVKELDDDQATILGLAQGLGGRITIKELQSRTSWSKDRSAIALENMLLRDGLCWVDEQTEDGNASFWILSAVKWDD